MMLHNLYYLGHRSNVCHRISSLFEGDLMYTYTMYIIHISRFLRNTFFFKIDFNNRTRLYGYDAI